MEPEVSILSNSAALHSLKRQQLVQLAKAFKLKASGKNVDLIARLRQHGTDLENDKVANASDASWQMVDEQSRSEMQEFGFEGQGTLSKSTSSSSIASTLKSAGTAVLRKFAPSHSSQSALDPPEPQTRPPSSIYPSLDDAFARYPASPEKCGAQEEAIDPNQTLEDFDHSREGAIRLVTTHTRTTIDTEHDLDLGADSTVPTVPPIPTTFVFGSPIAPDAPSNAFTFSMPGALLSLSSTSSITERNPSIPDPIESVMQEMNRRAQESRNLGIKLVDPSASVAPQSTRGAQNQSPEKGSRAVFEGKHKRAFDKMDSIANHYAAKRPHPSSTNLAGLAQSVSSSTKSLASLSSAPAERPVKRVKAGGASSQQLMHAMREAGWMTSANENDQGSLHAKGKGKKLSREDLANRRQDQADLREKERAERKRKLELAIARRKSGAVNAVATPRKRPSSIAAPKPSAPSSGAGFFRSTFKKFSTSSTSGFNRSAALAGPSAMTATAAVVPRFAIPTASSASRAGLVLPASSSRAAISSVATTDTSLGKKGGPGWKKFDLQESLKKPMKWKLPGSLSAKTTQPSGSSALNLPRPASMTLATSKPGAKQALGTAQTATTTSNLAKRSGLSVSSPEQTVVAKLASLPAAPTTPFAPLTNSSARTETKKRPLVTPAPRKVVSSSARKARGGKDKVEGLETKAKKIRAKQTPSASSRPARSVTK
ncbi:uncharacterized protein JCM15063_001415 [Sporobolomyces koalae]|uniref:uncharacterized protein n=1 Tax=Sporobolomyces koalae TaxID=500713 RepID=UPI003179270D